MDWSLLGFAGLAGMPNLHPAVVHLPLGLLPAAAGVWAWGTWRKDERWLFAGRALLGLAALGAALAVLSGLRAEDTIPHSEAVHRLLETHEATGWTTAVLSVLAFLLAWKGRGARAAWGAAALAALALAAAAQTADLGGRMVYLEGAGVKPAMEAAAKAEPAAPAGHEHHRHRH